MMQPYFEFFTDATRWGRHEAVGAHDVIVSFEDGSEALCGISGLWNASLGYGNVAVAEAIHRANLEASTLPLFRRGHVHARQAAERLIEFARPHSYAAVFYSTSGSAAIDTVVKLCRHVAQLRGQPQRRRMVSLIGSYHGMTLGAMALTGVDIHQQLYGADDRLHLKIPHDDPAALGIVMRRFGPQIAGVVVEPVLGSGALPVSDEMVDALLRAREEHGFLLVADEVATGFHLTGPAFGSHAWPEQPDVLVASKSLTNGTCASSALLVHDAVMGDVRGSGEIFWHGETQAGSPQACAAIMATLDELERLHAPTAVQRLALALDEHLSALAELSPGFTPSGRGAFRALRLAAPGGGDLSNDAVMTAVHACLDRGAIVQPGPTSLQFVPAFTYTPQDLDLLFARVRPVIERLAAAAAA